jgi:hypothetical protein
MFFPFSSSTKESHKLTLSNKFKLNAKNKYNPGQLCVFNKNLKFNFKTVKNFAFDHK